MITMDYSSVEFMPVPDSYNSRIVNLHTVSAGAISCLGLIVASTP
jgi:hypothetical protein